MKQLGVDLLARSFVTLPDQFSRRTDCSSANAVIQSELTNLDALQAPIGLHLILAN